MVKRAALSLVLAGAAAMALLAPASAPARACGPEFPTRLLLSPQDALLGLPDADFSREIARLVTRSERAGAPSQASLQGFPVVAAGHDPTYTTRKVERADLIAWLAANDVKGAAADKALKALDAAREAIHAPAMAPGDAGRDSALKSAKAAVAAVEPRALRVYLEGAVAWRAGDVGAATRSWREVLALPEAERVFRETWALYMLGEEARRRGDVADAKRWFGRLRERVAAGAPDTLGLGTTSLGEEAALARERGDWRAELALYVAQAAAGDPSGSTSLRQRALAMAREPADALAKYAKDDVARGVVTAFLLSPFGRYGVLATDATRLDAWLAAVEAIERSLVVDGAGRLAWLAYQGGRFETAERWLGLADVDAEPVARWVRAKLALRAGDRDSARADLAVVMRSFAEAESWDRSVYDEGSHGADRWRLRPRGRAGGDLALLALGRDDFVEALDLLLRGGYEVDGLSVAEGLVDVDTLRRYVDAQWPVAEPPPEHAWEGLGPGALVRLALGHRLVREGRAAEALPYLPEPERARLNEYIAALTLAELPGAPAEARASALWRAARLAREHGMEMMGTMTAPDWALWGGSYELPSTAGWRAERRSEQGIAKATDAELAAWARSAPTPNKRFHYRYVASELAAKAASHLPASSEDGAIMLCWATRWLLKRDPTAARVYYRDFIARNHLFPWSSSFGESCPSLP